MDWPDLQSHWHVAAIPLVLGVLLVTIGELLNRRRRRNVISEHKLAGQSLVILGMALLGMSFATFVTLLARSIAK